MRADDDTGDAGSTSVHVPVSPRADIFALLTRDSSSPADQPRPPSPTSRRGGFPQPAERERAGVHPRSGLRAQADRCLHAHRTGLLSAAGQLRARRHSIDDDAAYWLSGLRDYLKIKAAALRHGRLEGIPPRFLDLGCAAGRVLRHAYCQGEFTEVWGCDIDRRNVDWVKKHLPREVRVFQNSVYPSLPISGDFFRDQRGLDLHAHRHVRGCLAAGAAEGAPSGRDRVPDDPFRAQLAPNQQAPPRPETHAGCRSDQLGGRVTKETFDGPLPADRLVLTWPSATAYCFNTFHSMQYIRENWGRFFEVCGVYDGGMASFQDFVVLRRT